MIFRKCHTWEEPRLLYFGITTWTSAQGPLFATTLSQSLGPSLHRLGAQASNSVIQHNTKRTEGHLLRVVSFSCYTIVFGYTVSFIRPNLVVMVAGSGKGGYFPGWLNMH